MKAPPRKILLFASIIGATAAIGVAMASYDGMVGSVHFYGNGWYYGSKPRTHDFGRVPQPVMIPGWNLEDRREGESYSGFLEDWQGEGDEWNEAKWNFLRARNLETQGKYRQSLIAYKASRANKSFLQDRAELINSAHFSQVNGLPEYLRYTYRLSEEGGERFARAVRGLEFLKCAPEVEPHRQYALAWAEGKLHDAVLARRYFEIYRQFSASPRAESALIMAARTMLKFQKDRKISQGERLEARKFLGVLLTKFPESRFRDDAKGWLARCDYLDGLELKSVSNYRNLADKGSSDAIRWMAYDSIGEICRTNHQWAKEIKFLLMQRRLHDSDEHMTWTSKELRKRFSQINPSDAKVVQNQIRRSPELLESYIAFRIEDTELSRKQEASLLAFARSSLQGMRSTTPALQERVAQIAYNNGQYRLARSCAVKALDVAPRGEVRGRARYVLAASLARLGRPQDAIQQYKLLSASTAPHFLRQAGMEHLALLQERNGDRVQALRTFSKLKYDRDFCYMADAEVTPQELERYIEMYANSAEKPMLIYTLGMRYFRTEKYSRAVKTFQRLSKSQRLCFGLKPTELKENMEGVTDFDKLPLERDVLMSVQKLWKLDRIAKSESGLRLRAKSLYEMASYIYRERTLLFYSPGLWKGQRAFSISMFWNPNVNNNSEKKTLDRYCHEHETLVHVMELCKTVEKLPIHSPEVEQSMYTEGLAAERLSRLNEWWRGQKGLKKVAIASMRRLVKRFPHDPLVPAAKKYAHVFAEEDQPDYNR